MSENLLFGSTLPIMIQISGNSAYLAHKSYFYQKTNDKQS